MSGSVYKHDERRHQEALKGMEDVRRAVDRLTDTVLNQMRALEKAVDLADAASSQALRRTLQRDAAWQLLDRALDGLDAAAPFSGYATEELAQEIREEREQKAEAKR